MAVIGCMKMYKILLDHRRVLILVLTPLLLTILLPFYDQIGISQRACNCLYMLLLMAVYWCTEPVPLAVTALIPVVLAPLMGILESSAVTKNYFKDIVFLMFGSVLFAQAIQESGLHRRIALTFIKLFGTNPKLLMLGFMVPTWLLSMWMSNTVTTVLMVSILNCVILQLRERKPLDNDVHSQNTTEQIQLTEQGSRDAEAEVVVENPGVAAETQEGDNFEPLAKCLSLAVGYSATAGGVATLTGTPTNLVLYDHITSYGEKMGVDFRFNFLSWTLYALPISIIMVFVIWIWLQALFLWCRKSIIQKQDKERQRISEIINREYSSLGPISWQEGITLAHFIILILLWLTRNPGSAGGWGQLFPKGFVTDTTAVMLVDFSLFLMPKYPPMLFKMKDSRPYEPCLPWAVTAHLPWTVVFLIAGGLALADCVQNSGLSVYIGSGLSGIGDLPLGLMVFLTSLITAGVTEVASNVVIASIFIPILADLAINVNVHPLYLMVPCTVACSFAFMLPVATPPNAVVYSNGVLKIKDMVVAGVVMNSVGILVIMLASFTWLPLVFHFSEYNSNFSMTITGITANQTALIAAIVKENL